LLVDRYAGASMSTRRLGDALPRAIDIVSAIRIVTPKQDILARTKARFTTMCAQTGPTAVPLGSPAQF
jgi:hypothetical protein